MKNEFYLAAKAPDASTIEAAIHECKNSLLNSLSANGLDFSDLCFCRFFCSDVYNQTPIIRELWPDNHACQNVFIGQQPLDSAFVSVQAYAIKEPVSKEELGDGTLLVRHGSYTSLWTLDYPTKIDSPEKQTTEILAACEDKLARHSLDFADSVIRTWYYLRDIDNTYAGMIKSRVEQYEKWGLSPETHFTASTGIEGRSPWPHAYVGLQTHAVNGLLPEQIRYLKAIDHLSPTQLYGVNFERATLVQYGDRCHCHISGTASIDKAGNVLHLKNVLAQAERTLENIEALLQEVNLGLSDMLCATVYLRDPFTYGQVGDFIRTSLPENCAINFTCGAVCRPDWLIEIEGEAGAMRTSLFENFI